METRATRSLHREAHEAPVTMLNYHFIFHRRPQPTYMYRWDPSRISGSTLSSRKTMKATRDGLCAPSVQTRLFPLPVQLQLCGTTCDAFTPLRIPGVPSKLSINFPQKTNTYVPSRCRSDIWKYFKLKEDDESHKRWAVCNKCPDKSLAYAGATSTMWHHMRHVHSIENTRSSQ